MIKLYDMFEDTQLMAKIIQFDDGSAILKWMHDDDSVVIYKSMGDLLKIHEKGNRKIVDKLFIF